MKTDEYLTLADAVRELGISRSTLYRRIEDGAVPTNLSAANRRVKVVRRADVEPLLEPRPAKTVAAPQDNDHEEVR